MGKLTDRQLAILRQISAYRNGFFCAWSLGTQTCEALRKRGFVEGERPFTGGMTRRSDSPYIYITAAGRAALENSNEHS